MEGPAEAKAGRKQRQSSPQGEGSQPEWLHSSLDDAGGGLEGGVSSFSGARTQFPGLLASRRMAGFAVHCDRGVGGFREDRKQREPGRSQGKVNP